jgi:hypothetical protein
MLQCLEWIPGFGGQIADIEPGKITTAVASKLSPKPTIA